MKIMVVDDDKVALDLLNECLTQGGYEHVTLMDSSSKVIRKITDTAIAYDCILLDVEMPGKNGIDLCAEIRELARYRNTPIIMITKHKDRVAVEQAFKNGATDYVTKPFEFFEVLTRMRVAERLVQERQAAMDSYVAVQSATRQENRQEPAAAASRAGRAQVVPQQEITSEEIMSLATFQNYLEQVTRTEDCAINLIAVKVRRIAEIFAKSDPVEFVAFLKATADAMIEHTAPEKAFVTHFGNGIFLWAAAPEDGQDSLQTEQSLHALLAKAKLPVICQKDIPPEVIVGEPLTLTTTPKLNFKRACKAAVARVEQRDRGRANVTPLNSRGKDTRASENERLAKAQGR